MMLDGAGISLTCQDFQTLTGFSPQTLNVSPLKKRKVISTEGRNLIMGLEFIFNPELT